MGLVKYLVPLLFMQLVHSENSTRSTLCKEGFCTCTEDKEGDIIDCADKPTKYIQVLMEAAHYVDQNNNTYKIKKLIFNNVPLLSIEKSFPKSSLKILDLKGNRLQNITNSAFMNLQNMQELILSHNELSILDPEVLRGIRVDGQDYPLEALRTLRLDHNKFHTLNSDLFEHVDRLLENLYLNNNPFKIIDTSTHQAINSLIRLKVLDLSYTEIRVLPQNFMHTPANLETFLLNGNNITSIHDLGLGAAHSLKVLYLNENPIENITEKDGFPTVKTLEVLHMCRMPVLKMISEHSLCKLEGLQELHLSDNVHLEKIHQEAFIRKDPESEVPIVQNIKKLYIKNNKLTHLDLELNWGMLTEVDIVGNPWTCECENQWIIDTLIPKYIDLGKTTEAQDLICAAPIEMEGKHMYDLYMSKSTMRCLDLYGNRPERDGTILVCLLLGLLVGITLVLFCMYSYQRHWFSIFDNSPAAFSRQYYGRTKTSDVDDFN